MKLTIKITRSKGKTKKKEQIEKKIERDIPEEAEEVGCLCGNLMRGILFNKCPSAPIIAFFHFTLLSSVSFYLVISFCAVLCCVQQYRACLDFGKAYNEFWLSFFLFPFLCVLHKSRILNLLIFTLHLILGKTLGPLRFNLVHLVYLLNNKKDKFE